MPRHIECQETGRAKTVDRPSLLAARGAESLATVADRIFKHPTGSAVAGAGTRWAPISSKMDANRPAVQKLLHLGMWLRERAVPTSPVTLDDTTGSIDTFRILIAAGIMGKRSKTWMFVGT